LIPPAPNGQTTVLDEVAQAVAAVTFPTLPVKGGGGGAKEFMVCDSTDAVGTAVNCEVFNPTGVIVDAAQLTRRTRVDAQNLDYIGGPNVDELKTKRFKTDHTSIHMTMRLYV
jgi:hypothetical protein